MSKRLLAAEGWPADLVVTAMELASVALSFQTDAEIENWYGSVSPTVAAGLPYLLAPALGYGATLSIDEMMPLAVGALLGAPRPIWVSEETLEPIVARALRDLMQTMAFAGVVTFVEDAVTMTPLGTQFMAAYMREEGFNVPEQPSLQSLSAEELLATIIDATVFSGSQARADWQPHRSEEQRCRELVDGPAAVIAPASELIDDVGSQVLHLLSRLPISEAAEVLSAIGSTFPSKQVAKLARTEARKWRSRWGK